MTAALPVAWAAAAPEVGEYVALRAACGLGPRSAAAARLALPASLHAVTARTDGRLVAMGRVVGDGGCFAQIVDVAVAPEAQGAGLGREVVRRLVAWCEAALPGCCHLSLVSSARAVPLYEAAGFAACRGLDRYADPARPA